MHARRFASFVLGLWLGGGLLAMWLTTQNMRAPDRLLGAANPAARFELKALGPNARAVLLYQASEENRRDLRTWEIAQIGLGFLFFLAMLFGSGEGYVLLGGILVMVLLVCLQRFLIGTEMAALGRLLDFAPAASAAPDRIQLGVLQTGYWGVEAAKCAVGLILTGTMVFSRQRSGRSRNSRRQIDLVDKPDHRRVNW